MTHGMKDVASARALKTSISLRTWFLNRVYPIRKPSVAEILQFVYLYTGQRKSEWQEVYLQHWQSVLFTAKYFRRYFVFRYKTHIILILSFKSYPIFEHLTSFMEQLLMYFRRHKWMETNMVKGHSLQPNHFGPETFRDQGFFLCTITCKNWSGYYSGWNINNYSGRT